MPKLVYCSKCKKKLFYLPTGYQMDIKVVCVDCHNKKKTPTKKKKKIQTASANYAKVKKGVRPDVHPTYSFRSATEANFARILEYLKVNWKFEERAFMFDKFGYKTKPFVYVMDFEVTEGNEEFPAGFYEIKGYMNGQSRNKLKRLRLRYPEEAARTIVVIYNKYKKKDIEFCEKNNYRYMFYDAMTEKFGPLIPTWE